MMHWPRVILIFAAALLSRALCAQDSGGQAANPKQWSFYASGFGFVVPHSRSYFNPNLSTDHGWLHLEARYNNEDLDTGSVWVGYTFSAGDKLSLKLAPVIGAVFGRSEGIAPGYELTLDYKKIELSSQGEYVFEAKGPTGSFFYTWSELSYSPVRWFRAGIAVQRTKVYTTPFSVQRGILVGFSRKRFDFTTYVFNFGWTDPTLVFALGAHF